MLSGQLVKAVKSGFVNVCHNMMQLREMQYHFLEECHFLHILVPKILNM